jgi:hypothetical protein
MGPWCWASLTHRRLPGYGRRKVPTQTQHEAKAQDGDSK